MFYEENNFENETEYGSIENKVVKRHYPRTNNDQVLDFVFEKVFIIFLQIIINFFRIPIFTYEKTKSLLKVLWKLTLDIFLRWVSYRNFSGC